MSFDYETYKGFKDKKADKDVLRDKRNFLYTRALFLETNKAGKTEPLYTLGDVELQGLPSAYQVYMHSIDEYDAALKLVGSLRHWRKLSSQSWFLDGDPKLRCEGLKQWRLDMAARDRSLAKGLLIKQVEDGDTPSAAKSLLQIANSKTTLNRVRSPSPSLADEHQDSDDDDDFIAELHEQMLKGA